jgi:hypothetical protein
MTALTLPGPSDIGTVGYGIEAVVDPGNSYERVTDDVHAWER